MVPPLSPKSNAIHDIFVLPDWFNPSWVLSHGADFLQLLPLTKKKKKSLSLSCSLTRSQMIQTTVTVSYYYHSDPTPLLDQSSIQQNMDLYTQQITQQKQNYLAHLCDPSRWVCHCVGCVSWTPGRLHGHVGGQHYGLPASSFDFLTIK